jgi:hypothetical protein
MDLHTEANAVPALDGTDLGNLLEDLDGFDAGIDLIRAGLRLIALERHTADRTQTLAAVLAGAPGVDLLTAIGLTVARLTHPDTNPALRTLPFDSQKTTQMHGENLVRHLADDEDLHQHAAEAAAAITGT